MKHSSLASKLLIALLLITSTLVTSGIALAHKERPTDFPDGTGTVPKYRPMIATPNLVVCKKDSRERIRGIKNDKLRRQNIKLWSRCDFSNIQAAVDAVTRKGTTIYVLPGIYREKPTRSQPKCAEDLPEPSGEGGGAILSYKQQKNCSAAQNLIGIYGDDKPGDDKRQCNAAVCDLQIEGTGAEPNDVRITGGFTKDGEWA